MAAREVVTTVLYVVGIPAALVILLTAFAGFMGFMAIRNGINALEELGR